VTDPPVNMIWPPVSACAPGLLSPVVVIVVGVGDSPVSTAVVTVDWPPDIPSLPVAWIPGALSPDVMIDAPVSDTIPPAEARTPIAFVPGPGPTPVVTVTSVATIVDGVPDSESPLAHRPGAESPAVETDTPLSTADPPLAV
jgi:hypothetical protein